MRDSQKSIIKVIFFIFLISVLCPIVAETQAKDIDKREEKLISQIESYYTQGKKSLAKEDFLVAIVKFNHVIEVEKDFHIVYTPYAKQYIQQAKEEIRKREETNLNLDITKKPKENKMVENREIKKGVQKKESREGAETLKPEEASKILEYTIGEEDVLYISVWQEGDLSQEVIVRPDGKISFSLAGDVPVVGLTFTQLKEELTQRLKDYVKYPVISISLRKLGGKKVIVLGQVDSAGVYSVMGKKTVLEAVALAGGFTPDAVPSSTILIRGGLQNPEGRRLNLTRAIDRADMSQNVVLQSEDIIYVPKKFIANVNYAMTQIMGPISQGVYTAKTARAW